MTRHDMIERIGNAYMTSNIEGGEYSYIQEAGSRANLKMLWDAVYPTSNLIYALKKTI